MYTPRRANYRFDYVKLKIQVGSQHEILKTRLTKSYIARTVAKL